jgi:rhamnose utilization protein RhaD (predicted bifunctional aldolase and dehydrogenase)
METDMTQFKDLIALCNALGEPDRDLVLSAEGNVSMRLNDHTMSIKASGCSLATLDESNLLSVDINRILSLLNGTPTDHEIRETYKSALIEPSEKMPSVEAILHAVIYDLTPAQVIAHTHPTPVNMLTCSINAGLLVEGALYPDAIVMLGKRQVLVPYTDPGVPLAKAVRSSVITFMDQEGVAPKVIYLANHGLFVAADSPREALQVTEMAVKNARILHGTLSAGGPNFLPPEQVERIDKRPDETYRRQALGFE